MKEFLYYIVYRIADIHKAILQLNNSFEANLNDKMLHFWVIGLLGLVLFLVLRPLFGYLARKNCTGLIAWLYSFTVILGITFMIEIGQYFTHTGSMEFADIVFGVVGFLQLSFLWLLGKLALWGLGRLAAWVRSR